jgi:1,2-diacylglycerol 3-beta-galactosyltransferase
MNKPHSERPKVLFLFSDTGGGHRSAAEAIIESLNLNYPGQIDTEMVDIFRAAPPPMVLAITTYPAMAKMPMIWEAGYKWSNGRRRVRFIHDAFWPYVRRAAHRIVEDHAADLIVSVHPVPNMAVTRAMLANGIQIPYIIVVTDLFSTHAFWYDRHADLVIVPTDEARLRGVHYGLPYERMEVVGLPVADRFCHETGQREKLRARLGWPLDRPVILMVGGGDGMGPLGRTAIAVDNANLPATLAVVTGRNAKLRAKLEGRDWNMPAFVYGFVKDMPMLMQAADILVTKAGPGTISEAFIANLPIIMYSRMPGQEEGNVTYVVQENAGVWAPLPGKVVKTLRSWIENPAERARIAANSKRLGRPDASPHIARIIAQRVGVIEPE